MNFPKVTIIILNWNGIEDTTVCLESLKRISYPNYEILVVDNASTGNDVEILEKKYSGYVKLIKNDKNTGFAGGNNIAIKKMIGEGKSSYALILNNDTIVTPEFLTEMVKVCESDSSVGMATPRILNPDGSLQRSDRKFPTHFVNFLYFCVPKLFLSDRVKNFFAKTSLKKLLGEEAGSYFWSFESGETTEIDQGSGACLLVKEEVIRQVGMFDDRFFLYSEDLDWCYRTKKAGWKIIYVPAAVIVHLVGRSGKSEVEKSIYFCYKVESKHFFAIKHYNRSDILKTRLILLLGLIIRMPQVLYYYYAFRGKQKGLILWKLYRSVLIKIITNKTLWEKQNL